jgi:hypothetical protein
MKRKLVNLILEAAGRGLTIFDIDETLFHTKAFVQIKKNGKVIKKLDNLAYSKYKLKRGEELDFGQFKNSKIFNTTSTPMANMINKAKAIIRNATKSGSKVIFVTARADMDDKKLFIDTFKAQGIDMSKVYIERAGNFGTETGKIKSIVFRKYLDTGKYRRIRLFDDSMENLLALLALKDDYPNVQFEAYRVSRKGLIKTIK